MFSQFEETSRLTVMISGESTCIASRLRVVTSGIRVIVPPSDNFLNLLSHVDLSNCFASGLVVC